MLNRPPYAADHDPDTWEEAPTIRDQLAKQPCPVLGTNEQLDKVLWFALLGIANSSFRTHRQTLEAIDAVMALAKQLPGPYYREFVDAVNDSFPELKGRW